MVTVDGDVHRMDRRSRGNARGKGVTGSVPGFIGFVIPSRMDDNGSLRRRRGRRSRNRRVGSEHKADLFIGRGEMDDRTGRRVRVTSRDDVHSDIFKRKGG